MDTKKLLDEAKGYRTLGLVDEAEAVLRKVMTTEDCAARDEAQCRLMTLLLGEGRFQEVADLGAELIGRKVFLHGAIIDTMLALNHLGRIEEARTTLRLVKRCGHDILEEAYQMACFASRLGEFPDALIWLCFEFHRSTEFHAQSFTDTDLIPFWNWLRDFQPALGDAHLLVETPFQDVCAAALGEDAPIELGAGDLASLVERQRQIFRYDYKVGSFIPNPLAVANDPEAAEEFVRMRKDRLATVKDIVVEAQKRAAELVLDAQPRYAAEHAAWGNHFGARYHILWGMRFKPKLMWQFLNEPGLEMMKPLLNEILGGMFEDLAFVRRLEQVYDLKGSDCDRAWGLLNETPEILRKTGLYQLRLAGLHEAEQNYEAALPIWRELCLRWPNDAVGFVMAWNACSNLAGRMRHTNSWKIPQHAIGDFSNTGSSRSG